MKDTSIYYSYDKIMSYDFLLAFIIGERGTGKSYGAKKLVLKKFLKTGEQFIYLRRYKTELDIALTTFWNDVQTDPEFVDLELKVKKNKTVTEFMCNGKVCGYAIPLSTSNIMKSTPFPNVSIIIFDEFMLDSGGTYRYLKFETTMMLDCIESVGRLRPIKVLFLGNATSLYGNPYFAYFDLSLPYNSEFKTFKDGAIVVNYIKNLKYREVKKQSRFGKLIDGTDYGRYAIDNESLRDSNSFIRKRPSDSTFYGVIIANGLGVGIWTSKSGYIYLSEKYDPNTVHKFACDFDDHTEATIFLSLRENLYLHYVVRAYKQGILRFENQRVKTAMMKLINRCISV